jgi:hypothetical protein
MSRRRRTYRRRDPRLSEQIAFIASLTALAWLIGLGYIAMTGAPAW